MEKNFYLDCVKLHSVMTFNIYLKYHDVMLISMTRKKGFGVLCACVWLHSDHTVIQYVQKLKHKQRMFSLGIFIEGQKNNNHNFREEMNDILTIVCSENKACTDGNSTLYLRENKSPITNLFGHLNSKMFLFVTTKLKRVPAASAAILDYILINEINGSIGNGIIYFDISDHFPIFS